MPKLTFYFSVKARNDYGVYQLTLNTLQFHCFNGQDFNMYLTLPPCGFLVNKWNGTWMMEKYSVFYTDVTVISWATISDGR